MTRREKPVVRILLTIARMFADDPVIRDEIKHLSNHVSQLMPEQLLPERASNE